MLLENGNMLSKNERYPAEKGVLIAKTLSIMGYDAVNLGTNDFFWEPEFMSALDSSGSYAVLCADATADGEAWLPFTVVSKNDLQVGIIGVGGSFAEEKAERLSIEPPLRAIQKALIALRQKADIVILLSQLNYGDTLDILSRVDGVDVAIVGGVRVGPFRLKNTVVTGYSKRGEYVAGLTVLWNPRTRTIPEYSQKLYQLGADYKPDSSLDALFDEYNAATKRQDAAAKRQDVTNAQLIEKFRKMTPDEFMKVYENRLNTQSTNKGAGSHAN